MKKLTVFILAALIAITCVSTALAADWVEIGRDSGRIYYVDVSSVRQTGNTFRMWEKVIWHNPQTQAEFKKALRLSKTPANGVAYMEYKIDEPTARMISSTYYAKDGSVIRSNGEDYEWLMFPPDSAGEGAWYLCRRVLGLE